MRYFETHSPWRLIRTGNKVSQSCVRIKRSVPAAALSTSSSLVKPCQALHKDRKQIQGPGGSLPLIERGILHESFQRKSRTKYSVYAQCSLRLEMDFKACQPVFDNDSYAGMRVKIDGS